MPAVSAILHAPGAAPTTAHACTCSCEAHDSLWAPPTHVCSPTRLCARCRLVQSSSDAPRSIDARGTCARDGANRHVIRRANWRERLRAARCRARGACARTRPPPRALSLCINPLEGYVARRRARNRRADRRCPPHLSPRQSAQPPASGARCRARIKRARPLPRTAAADSHQRLQGRRPAPKRAKKWLL